MIDLSTTVREMHYMISLNEGFRSDLKYVVGHIPSNMEWGGDDVRGHPSVGGRNVTRSLCVVH